MAKQLTQEQIEAQNAAANAAAEAANAAANRAAEAANVAANLSDGKPIKHPSISNDHKSPF